MFLFIIPSYLFAVNTNFSKERKINLFIYIYDCVVCNKYYKIKLISMNHPKIADYSHVKSNTDFWAAGYVIILTRVKGQCLKI